MPNIPPSLIVTNCGYAMDGGSIYLEFRAGDGAKHTLELPQHLLSQNFSPAEPPGALIFDGFPLKVRGEDEAALLVALRNATFVDLGSSEPSPDRVAPAERRLIFGDDIKSYFAAVDCGPSVAKQYLVHRVLVFVESDEYLDVARRHGRLT